MKPTVKVVAALLESGTNDGRYWVQQRKPGGPRGGLWEFPGGKVERGESDESALLRELHEELGVRATIGRALWSTSHEYEDVIVELHIYRAAAIEGTPSSLDGQVLRALLPTELIALPFCEADRPFLEALVRGLAVPTRM